jgi:uncharacterized membrane protein YjjP (DUF1212 family)
VSPFLGADHDDASVQFVVELAGALSRAGAAAGIVQQRMAQIAWRYGVPEARIVVLPNLTLAAEGRGMPVELDTTAPSEADLRLDQMAAVERLARHADRGAVSPVTGLDELDRLAALRHRFGAPGTVIGHTVISIGLSLILQPTPIVLLSSAVFGAGVGLLKVAVQDMPTLRVLLPITVATLVSLIAFLVAPDKTAQESLRALIPPLVTFLPGGMITSATLDLAAGHLISGSTRLVAGGMQLVLLAVGIAIGAELAGINLTVATGGQPANTLGAWAPWLGAIVFGIGCHLHFSGERGSLRWLLLVVLSAWIGEDVGGQLLSGQLGAFTGAVVVTPVAAWVETRPTGPPSLATMMPAFWLLVPGAVGLLGAAQFVGAKTTGADRFVDPFVTFIVIGLGVFLGNTIVLRYRARRGSGPGR